MVLNAIFGQLLAFHPTIAVAIFAVITLVIINVFYKLLIKQEEAKQIKERQKELSKRMKEERKAGNTEKVNQLMKELLQENSRLMKMTLKPMLISFVIVIVLLPWLHGAYGDVFSSDGRVTLSGAEYGVSASGNSVTVNGVACDMPCTEKISSRLYDISPDAGKVKFAPVVAAVPFSLPVLGSTLGWLSWYIIISIPIVILTRKLMKIYV